MEYYGLELAGLTISLCTERELTITDRLAPFLAKETAGQPVCSIELISCNQMPPLPENGIRRGLAYYGYNKGEQWIFHYESASDGAFAWVRFQSDGHIRVQYLPEYAHFFAGTAGVFNRIGAESLLLQHRRLLLHASFIKDGERGILFSGPSGIGKSTQAELWRMHRGAEIINGDRVTVGQKDGKWTAWGIPYAGSSQIYRNESAQIKAVVMLCKAKENRIQRLRTTKAVTRLYPELTIHPWDENYVDKVLEILGDMAEEVPVYLMECLPDVSAVEALYDFLEKERE